MKNSVGCRLFLSHTSFDAVMNSSYSGSGSLTPGNRSDMIPSNNGISWDRNYTEGRRYST